MKFKINDSCIGCGLCADTCPEIFQLNEDELAQASEEEVEPPLLDSAIEAMENCPVSAIEEA